MNKNSTDNPTNVIRETGVQYVVDTSGQHVAVLLPKKEYEHYLDLLADEADSQDTKLAERLAQASSQPAGGERQSFRDYLRQHGIDDASLQN